MLQLLDRSGEKPYCTFIICIRFHFVNKRFHFIFMLRNNSFYIRFLKPTASLFLFVAVGFKGVTLRFPNDLFLRRSVFGCIASKIFYRIIASTLRIYAVLRNNSFSCSGTLHLQSAFKAYCSVVFTLLQ